MCCMDSVHCSFMHFWQFMCTMPVLYLQHTCCMYYDINVKNIVFVCRVAFVCIFFKGIPQFLIEFLIECVKILNFLTIFKNVNHNNKNERLPKKINQDYKYNLFSPVYPLNLYWIAYLNWVEYFLNKSLGFNIDLNNIWAQFNIELNLKRHCSGL